jgi:hypothetical protein
MEPNRDLASRESIKSIPGGSTTGLHTQQRPNGASGAKVAAASKDTLITRFLRWLYPDQRKARRHAYPPIVSYLGAVQTTRPYQIADISVAGFFMVTVDRWLLGTEMPVTLHRTDKPGKISDACLTLPSTVVRTGPTGVAFSFVLHEQDEATRQNVERFLEGLELSEFEELEQAS